jgi:hypothetical protein
MRFARLGPALLLAAACLLLLALPAASQIRSRAAAAAGRPVAVFSTAFADAPAVAARPDPVLLRLLSLGARGAEIAQAREDVISILSTENSCSAWFRQADPDPLAVFESLDITLFNGQKFVAAVKTLGGPTMFMHPYSAAVQENGGNKAVIQLNANGPFFARVADVLERDSPNSFAYFAGRRALRVGSYDGNTLPARIATLLHELGHAIGRLPDDSDLRTGLSDQNTQRVLRACHAEIKASSRQHHAKTD